MPQQQRLSYDFPALIMRAPIGASEDLLQFYRQLQQVLQATKDSFLLVAKAVNTNISVSGTTAQRPTTGLVVGQMYFDTTLNRPIWRNAANDGWVFSDGTAA